jgi:AraC family transcriptional regulator of adaptative response/methylated-DNA-[protein]-cysteine methyltransferase
MIAVEMPATTTLNEDNCWEAVLQRRASSDGLFVVAVRTTKIYCRPSCPSRRPMRQNVRFFAGPDEAERAGYRACKRCRPRDPVRRDASLVKEICRRLEDCTVAAPTLGELSAEFGVSQFHLQRTFKRVTGLSPRRYAESFRSARLKDGLRGTNGVASAVYAAGYGSSSRVYETSRGMLGMTPGRYGRGGAGMRISYTITTCTFGRMLVGATEHGVSAVSFGDSEAPLERELRLEYPAAEISRDDAAMRRWVDAVVRAIETGEERPPLPLDIQATAFRARVWQALRAIPRGETRSYSEIAREVGAPKAARAVGNACKSNPVAGIIPCHRVVREDGSLGGYLSGVARKRALLDHEKKRR